MEVVVGEEVDEVVVGKFVPGPHIEVCIHVLAPLYMLAQNAPAQQSLWTAHVTP